ncbi:MAG TPA: tyrosinase family protein [Pyrinomonadaceae bacterium]|jgi:tyrosinase
MLKISKVTRRKFLGVASLATGGAVLGLGDDLLTASAQVVRVRPNISDPGLNPRVVQALRDGVRAMKALPATNARSWNSQARIHNDWCPHSNWFFLPWHRAYILYFERICRQASGWADFMLPYWDWTANPRVPAPFWGGTTATNPLLDTTRQVTPTSVASPTFVGQPVINNILGITDFQTFASNASTTQRGSAGSGELESRPHNYIHGTFIRGNMATYMSPLDPIFWLHHANIDRIWARWNLSHNNTSNTSWRNFTLSRFYDINTNTWVTVRPSQMISTYALGYRYPDQPVAPPRVARAFESFAPVPRNLRAVRAVNQEARTSAPVSVDVAVPNALQRRLSTAAVAPSGDVAGQRSQIRLSVGVKRPADTATAVHIFINTENAGPNTPLTDPGYVGTFAFFNGHEGHGRRGAAAAADNDLTFLFDVTDDIQELASVNPGRADGRSVRVTVVPVYGDDDGRRAEARVTTTNIRLEAIS